MAELVEPFTATAPPCASGLAGVPKEQPHEGGCTALRLRKGLAEFLDDQREGL